MRLNRLFRNASIRQRVLILALLPTLLATLVLAVAMTSQRLQDAHDDMLADGFIMLDYLAAGAEYGLLSGNDDALAAIAKPALNNPMIGDITFLDAVGHPLFGQQRPTSEQLSQWQAPGYTSSPGRWLLFQPIKLTALDVDDYVSETDAPSTQLGWVLLELNDSLLTRKKDEILRLAVVISVAGLVIALWLAWQIGHTLIRPIRKISTTVECLQQNQLDARAHVDDGGELGDLATGINELAREVQRTQGNLESEVQQATEELQVAMDAMTLQNRQLEQARADAETANRTKDEFLARMSHELRTPLTSVVGFTELLEKTALNQTQQEYLQVAQQASQLLRSLIDDLLDFSKLSSDAITLEQISFSVDACIEQVIDMHSVSARKKGIDLIYVTDPKLPAQVSGDPTRISQIVSNLVSNALKFTDNGEVAVTLNSERRGRFIQLTMEVRDSGIGISTEQQENLFKPFVQADETITRRFGGSGLGLVICQRLTELMGGTLQLDSAEGVGTQVRLELPLRVLSDASSPSVFAAMSILLYDRNPLSLQATCRRLEYLGCQVTTANNHRQFQKALEEHEGRDFERLVISLSQRELDSLSRIDFLTALPAMTSSAILLISNQEPERLIRTFPKLGDTQAEFQFLQKPFSRQTLIQALNGASTTAEDSHAEQSGTSLEGLTVLVAEDNRFNQELIKRMLALHGARVRLASNGRDALRCIDENPVDMVLMDLHMPEMDGMETISAIRNLPGPESGLPVVVLTASPLKGYQQQFERLKVCSALNKPLDEQVLVNTISRICNVGSVIPASQPDNSSRLDRYGIEGRALQMELKQQLTALEQGYASHDSMLMRDHTHQLMGLAGLLGMTELDQAAEKLNRAVKAEQTETVKAALEHLAQLINGIQPGSVKSRNS